MNAMNPISGTDTALPAAPFGIASAEAPLQTLFVEWQALHQLEKRLYQDNDDFDEDSQCADATARLLATEDAMLGIPAADASEWLLKFWAVTEGGDLAMVRASNAGLWAEARALIAGDLTDVDSSIRAVESRVAFVAQILGVSPPARVLDDDDCVAPEFMEFAKSTGACMNFIFAGDLRSMIMSDCEARKGSGRAPV